jgi:hypothetical protein
LLIINKTDISLTFLQLTDRYAADLPIRQSGVSEFSIRQPWRS